MKKNLLTILTAITMMATVAVAQPTLTATGINPVIGDVYTFKYGPGINPGSAASNQTWSALPASTSTIITYTSSAVSATPYAASFPNANFSYNGGGSYLFYSTSATDLKNHGVYGGATLISYSNPEELLHYPFNMGNTYSDSWSANFTSGGFPFVRTGTTTVTYDGYGSMTLSSGTYSNVVRVHFVQVYNDVYSGGTINYNNNEYMWYLNGNHQPIVSTYTITNSVNGASNASVILSNLTNSVFEHEGFASNIISFPNPAANEVTFNFNNSTTISAIDILDISGKNVFSKTLANNGIENYATVNTSDFKEGIYFAKFTTKDGQTGTKKISIVR